LEKLSYRESSKTFLQKVASRIADIKSASIYKRIQKHIVGTKILDIGTGIGGIAAYLANKNFEMTLTLE
jgi:2-polyprenyl-3-methyl-5-hydroxy-6-metoxy-1,4-benzoquinol methylase